jgi:hypothetical protein
LYFACLLSPCRHDLAAGIFLPAAGRLMVGLTVTPPAWW